MLERSMLDAGFGLPVIRLIQTRRAVTMPEKDVGGPVRLSLKNANINSTIL